MQNSRFEVYNQEGHKLPLFTLENEITNNIPEQQQIYKTNGHRGSEGQDTITPLTNSVFIKQLNKIKQTGSLKSINSFHASSSSLASSNSKQIKHSSSLEDQKSNKNLTLRTNSDNGKIPSNFMNIFRPKKKSESSSAVSIVDLLLSHSEQHENSDNKKTVKKFNSDDLFDKSLSMGKSNKAEQLFDAINGIIHNPYNQVLIDEQFIQNIRQIVRDTELARKQKLNKIRWLCTIFTVLFFLFMFCFVILFVLRVNRISENFIAQIKYSNQTKYGYD